MFTGLIEAVGRVAELSSQGEGARLRVAMGELPRADLRPGESIAVSGCCLTATGFDGEFFSADLSAETLARTTLGGLRAGAAVNLERAMLPSARLGGHLVSGHVDGVGQVAAVTDEAGGAQRWRFDAPPGLLRYIAGKGSICVDGVSLTVNAVVGRGFEVTLVPHTLAHTAFAVTPVGAAVNLEVDLVARYVERLLQSREWGIGNRE